MCGNFFQKYNIPLKSFYICNIFIIFAEKKYYGVESRDISTMKLYTHQEMLDRVVGEVGTSRRDAMKFFRLSFAALALSMLALTAVAQTKIVAHRGFWDTPGSAQNSLAGLRLADSIGVYAVECDVWLTRDGGLVVDHNRVFKGVDIPKATMPEACAVTLDNGEKLPTFDEFLAYARRFPGLRLVVELKSEGFDVEYEKEAIVKILKALEYFGDMQRTDFIAFSLTACKLFHEEAPETPVFYLNGDLSPAEIAALGFRGIDYSRRTMEAHPEWIAEAHRLGLLVNVWTIDSEEHMHEFIGQGADFITTNKPLLLQSILNAD